jgi:hypoxanthine phosphoribosyltransferase
MINDIKKISVSKEQIDDICKRLGKQISEDFKGKEPVFIGLLKGCNPFMVDLLKEVTIHCSIDYLDVSSYNGTSSTRVVVLHKDFRTDVKGKDVIIIDDILDSGRTLQEVKKLILKRGANSIKLCVLLDKPEGRVVDIQADYVGGLVPNEFVVGYGLDYNEKYRNLPFIGVLKEEIYSK